MIRTCTLALAALLPVVASAQFKAIGTAKDAAKKADQANVEKSQAIDAATGPETSAPGGLAIERAPAVRLEGSATAAPGQGAVPPPDTYTIRPGDTLWDLSGRFLNNPWYWPKVWSFNPDITNPHWIEPGNVLKFYPSAEEAPIRVEPAQPTDAVAAVVTGPEVAEEPEVVAPKELEDLSRGDIRGPTLVGDGDEVLVAGPYKIGFAPAKTVMARRDAFVTPREVEGSGSLVAAHNERLMLSTNDQAYARFKSTADVVPGETYVIYKTERPIHHPITKELIGYQSSILGTAKAVKVDDKAVTVVIKQALDAIERGALLGPWTERLLRPVTQRPNTRDVSGRILGAPIDILTMLGEQHVVFLDKGKADGVEEGNVFRVVRSGDLSGHEDHDGLKWDPSLPTEVVGDLMVIDVKETTSSALVTRSLTELAIGDRVEMRATGAN